MLFFVLTSFIPVFAKEVKPLIGISSSFKNNKVSVNYDYVKAIEKNGGIPVVLPCPTNDETINSYLKILDGLLLIGGPDIPPGFYHQRKHPTTKPMAIERFSFESRFIKKWLKMNKPTLGICLGMQISNVISGGSMIQDLPSLVGTTVTHKGSGHYTNYHAVGIIKGTKLNKILKANQIKVLSRHHQAVKKIGKNLKVCARSKDGIVEALERTDGTYGIFVQWHPEGMFKYPEHQKRLFTSFVDACR